MNIPSRSSRSGFTLVEMLVVIAIIAILASVVVAGASGAINAAKRVKAGNTASQIQTAILNYDTEYGVYPVPTDTPTGVDTYYKDSDQPDWEQLMWALCGNINASTGQTQTSTVPTARAIAFITPKRSDVDTNGILINPFFTTATAQANNGYYFLVMNTSYNGVAGQSLAETMPDFSGTLWKTGSAIGYINGGVTQGVAIWADCDTTSLPPNEANSKAPNFWVHTY
jgi:prepilin-type N-terminal cleavage/methylation domain-containing protein